MSEPNPMDPQPPTAHRSLESVRYDVAEYQKLRDALDLRSWASDQLHEDLKFLLADADRLDWLERMANTAQGLHLHEGGHTGCQGLGLRPGLQKRTLRQAIDTARAGEKPAVRS